MVPEDPSEAMARLTRDSALVPPTIRFLNDSTYWASAKGAGGGSRVGPRRRSRRAAHLAPERANRQSRRAAHPESFSLRVSRSPLSAASASLDACQAACVAYVNEDVSPVSGWTRCTSFTFLDAADGKP